MDTQIIILAGGLGKRMGGDIPKVLTLLKGKPLIQYTLEAVKKSKVCERPAIVVGKMPEMVRNAVGPGYEYILQPEQLGTGHAVMVSKPHLFGKSKNVLVLYGDQPFITGEMIKKLVDIHERNNATLSMMTVTVTDFNDWREAFYGFGRVVRDKNGNLVSIVELKDCREEEKNIKEVNPSFFCFDARWLWRNIEKLNNENKQKEYYLTDLLELAKEQGKRVSSIPVDPKVAIGINTPYELAWAEKLIS